MEIGRVGAELFHAGWRAGGRTDRHDEAYNHFSQFCERENKILIIPDKH
jgi:hypothetical protein